MWKEEVVVLLKIVTRQWGLEGLGKTTKVRSGDSLHYGRGSKQVPTEYKSSVSASVSLLGRESMKC